MRYQTRNAPAPATSTPTWMRVVGMTGRKSSKASDLGLGHVRREVRNGPLMRMLARLMPMKLIISVVMISLIE